MSLNIEILYSKDCTDWETAAQLMEQALAELGLESDITYWLVENDRQAIEWHFIGSPSVHINNADLFPSDTPDGLRLRSYFTEEGLLGHPTYNMFLEALQAYL